MKHIRNRLNKLSRQLLSIIAIIFGIFLLTIGIILPNALKPLLERSLYDYLKQKISHGAYTEDLANLLLESVQIIENANKNRLAKEPIKLNFMQYDTHPLRDDKDVKFDVVFNETSAIWK